MTIASFRYLCPLRLSRSRTGRARDRAWREDRREGGISLGGGRRGERSIARSHPQKRIWQMHRSRFQSPAHATRRGGRRSSHTVKFMKARRSFFDAGDALACVASGWICLLHHMKDFKLLSVKIFRAHRQTERCRRPDLFHFNWAAKTRIRCDTRRRQTRSGRHGRANALPKGPLLNMKRPKSECQQFCAEIPERMGLFTTLQGGHFWSFKLQRSHRGHAIALHRPVEGLALDKP